MADWKAVLKADPTNWLLEADNSSVRCFALIGLLGRPENDPEVAKAKNAIMEAGAVPKILVKQKKSGYWGIPENFYVRGKYKGTVWQLIILAELGADKNDDRIKNACEFILGHSQNRESGAFSFHGTEDAGGRRDSVIPCLTGNMVWSLIRLGYLNNPRVQRGINWIVSYQRFDDRTKEKLKGWPYEKRERCFGRHSCHMGVVKALKALAEIPENKRSLRVRDTIEKGAEYMLQHHIFKRSHDLKQMSKPEWARFGFPLMWNTDALEILGILTKLGYRDERMHEAVDLVVSKQDERGRWKLETTFNGRFQADIERKGEPSKWVTLNALKALKSFYSRT
jgi:hypothetical protein